MSDIDDANNPEKQALGKRLRGLRDSFGWTLEEVSQATKQADPQNEGVSKVSISRYENGDSYPGYREIKLLSQALGSTVAFVFYGDMPDPYSGFELSLDEYFQNLIKDALIDHGLIKGVSSRQRQTQKAIALQTLQGHRRPFTLEGKDAAESAVLKQSREDRLDRLAETVPRKEKAKLVKKLK